MMAYEHDTINTTQDDKIRAECVDPDLRQMAAKEDAKYVHMFEQLGTEDGYLSVKQGTPVLGKSDLPEETLTRVWALADSDCDGRLSLKVRALTIHTCLVAIFTGTK